MSDVTFGVKVTEEIKNELSELMKTKALSGKEFMQLLLTTYKTEEAKQEDPLLESDLSELQMLLQRIQNLYLNMNERSKMILTQSDKEYDEALKKQRLENEDLKDKNSALEHKVLELEKTLKNQTEAFSKQNEDTKIISAQLEEYKQQVKSYLLLNAKLDQEIQQLKNQIESYKRLEIEIEERNSENTILKNRNDDLASEIWFLKRDLEKISEEKNQLSLHYAFELKNSILEQKIAYTEKIEALKDENNQLQKAFNEKLQHLYETIGQQE